MGPPSGLFAELSKWRDKAIKRGKATRFNSDIIPAWLNDELVAAQEVVGPDAAFSFLKQVPLSVRMKAEREIKRKIQKILSKYEGRAARSVKQGKEFDYAGMADELRTAVLPELSSLMVDNTLRLSVDTGISFDPAVINTEALRWAREFSTEWAQGLSETTRKQLQEAMSAFIQTPGMTMGDITRLIEPAFGPVRADMIASTEVTRAYSMATNETQALLRAETPDLTTTRVWNTMEDERVCFPAWTMVDTEAGPRAIQDIEPGEMAHTRAGYRRVMTTNERKYSGRMIRIETEDRAVEATASHLFWTAEQEWTQASELKPGHTLQLANGIGAVIQQVVDMYSVGLSVYNLQVEVPEYFANGVLVHNCPICGPLEGAPEEEWRAEFPNGPPAHPRCRCSSSIRFETPGQLEQEFGERQAERERWLRAEGLWTGKRNRRQSYPGDWGTNDA